ncbi:hypothetical protein A4X06_0g6183 [Tilletia controversa]|uniref:Uncharacterized protein n=1 Tax=Tilletia controversa TaxID=13291 RepID=A0A8X7MQ37_9BASI|nr:hypothetical protein A4X06_0g6183 [Tilletia controversa]
MPMRLRKLPISHAARSLANAPPATTLPFLTRPPAFVSAFSSSARVAASKATKKKEKKSSVAKGKEPIPEHTTDDMLLRIEAAANQRQQDSHPAQDALRHVLDQLRKYNTIADDLVHICNHDRKLAQITPLGLHHALLAFGQAENRLREAMRLAKRAETQPSSSKMTLRNSNRDDYIFAEAMLAKLKKRLAVLAYRFCQVRRDADVSALSPSPTHDAYTHIFGYRDIRLYNTLLNLALGYLNDVRLFQHVMDALKRRQIVPNNITLTILLQHAGRRKNPTLAKAVVQLGIKMFDAVPQDARATWAEWTPHDSDATSTTTPETTRSTTTTTTARLSPPRVQSHPVMRLITSAIHTSDSHLLLALLTLLDTFETEIFSLRSAKRGKKYSLPRPWPRISIAATALAMYPSLRRRGAGGAVPSHRYLGSARRQYLGLDRSSSSSSRTRTRPAGLDREMDMDLDRALPQHSPFVITAVLTALVHEGRFSMISRVWALMKDLSRQSERSQGSSSGQEQEQEQERGHKQVPWLIPVRAATTYMKAVSAIIAQDPRFQLSRSAGIILPPGTSSSSSSASSYPAAGAGDSRRSSAVVVGSRRKFGGWPADVRLARAAEVRSAAARHNLARCYLFLRRHWGIASSPASACTSAATSQRASPPPPPSVRSSASTTTDARADQVQIVNKEKPDRYFFAVLLNAVLPRYDGPLAFVDWRMVMMRLHKRFPGRRLPPPAPAPPRTMRGREEDTSAAVRVGDALFARPAPTEKHRREGDVSSSSSSSTAQTVAQLVRLGNDRKTRRRIPVGLLSGGQLELELTRLVLADMAALGIEARE